MPRVAWEILPDWKKYGKKAPGRKPSATKKRKPKRKPTDPDSSLPRRWKPCPIRLPEPESLKDNMLACVSCDTLVKVTDQNIEACRRVKCWWSICAACREAVCEIVSD